MSIYESTKILFGEAMLRYREALLEEGKGDRSNKLEVVMLEVFNNTVSDNEKQMALIKEVEHKLLVLGGKG